MRKSGGNARVTLAQGEVDQQVSKRGVVEIEEDASVDPVMPFVSGDSVDGRILSARFR